MACQGSRVGVRAEAGELVLSNLESGEMIARHLISQGKGMVIRNNDHYRDEVVRVAGLLRQDEANEVPYLAFAGTLVEKLELAKIRGEMEKQITTLQKFDLLIIDEPGYLPMNRQACYNLLHLVNTLYEYRLVKITTNKGFTAWGEFSADDNVAVPIVDRLIHHSHTFMPGGES